MEAPKGVAHCDQRRGVEKKNDQARRLVDAVKKGDVQDTRKGVGVQSLLQRGVDPNSADGGGCTPLHYACSNGQLHVVKALLDHPGINVNAQDSYGRTPLHWAVSSGHVDVVKMLLERPAVDRALQTNLGKTAGDLAVQTGRQHIVQLFGTSH
eukprot:TRINITY_DN8992_c0_g1_i1.p2 TRINITY_DN8992_c0_g1~~TRINITY_DN8992_c0_g1_i1.p2  ORF type:complete len:153 (-),score=25.88 TRINITY_DN8992_c0_g1_i1:81-539(-)